MLTNNYRIWHSRMVWIGAVTLAMFTCLSSCQEDSVKMSAEGIPEDREAPRAVATTNEGEIKFDFEAALSLIHRINGGESYEFFQSEWEGLRFELQKTSLINRLPKEQRMALWWSTEYMRSCARPEIFRDHSHEIVPILFSFDLPEMNHELKGILVDSGQL